MSGSTREPVVWELRVKRSELAQALRTVGRASRAVSDAEAILTFEAGSLTIDLAGTSARLPASGGAWPREVRLPGDALDRLAKVLPAEDPLHLRINGGRFWAARFSIPCECREASVPTPVREMVSPNADLFEVLLIRSRCSDEEIDAAGVAPLISNAQTRLQVLCAKPAQLLSRYGITASDFRAVCDRHIKDGSRQFCEGDRAMIRQIADVWELLAPLGVEINDIKELMDSRLRSAWKR